MEMALSCKLLSVSSSVRTEGRLNDRCKYGVRWENDIGFYIWEPQGDY